AANVPFGALGIQSVASTAAPSGTHTPEHEPILLEQETLGRGAYGVVARVWDVSTGREYASKRFTNLDKSDLEKEACLMRQSPHLVMEYVPMGNLEGQHRQRKISEDEAITILQQVLSALVFLHEQSPPIVHRDIKPENLLVQSRQPIHIKLGDFGLSKASEDLKTLCGTPMYLPPELAKYHGSKSSRLVEHLNDWESEELIDVLSEMIVMDPHNDNSSLLTVSTEVEWTSTGTSLNGPKVHPVNSTNFDWWYIDAVLSNVHGRDLSSIVIKFYTASPGGIEAISNTSTVLDTSISGTWANGSAFGFDAYPSGTVIFTEGNSSDGRWGGYSSWTSAEDRTKYAIEFSDPTAGLLGYMILTGVCRLHQST
ncbi:hypothetical protein B0A55_13047, partial [Friedmanniomyces simplex]